jgi:hypothetical protein
VDTSISVELCASIFTVEASSERMHPNYTGMMTWIVVTENHVEGRSDRFVSELLTRVAKGTQLKIQTVRLHSQKS